MKTNYPEQVYKAINDIAVHTSPLGAYIVTHLDYLQKRKQNGARNEAAAAYIDKEINILTALNESMKAATQALSTARAYSRLAAKNYIIDIQAAVLLATQNESKGINIIAQQAAQIVELQNEINALHGRD
jgi:hypothetical protein